MVENEKKVKTSVGLSPANVKWMKDHHINVSDLVDSLVTDYRQMMSGGLTTVKKETVRRALAKEVTGNLPKDDQQSPAKGPTNILSPPELPKEDA